MKPCRIEAASSFVAGPLPDLGLHSLQDLVPGDVGRQRPMPVGVAREDVLSSRGRVVAAAGAGAGRLPARFDGFHRLAQRLARLDDRLVTPRLTSTRHLLAAQCTAVACRRRDCEIAIVQGPSLRGAERGCNAIGFPHRHRLLLAASCRRVVAVCVLDHYSPGHGRPLPFVT